MPFDYTLSDKIKDIIERMAKKDRKRLEILRNKITQIRNSDEFTIEHFKNLKRPENDKKRVHVDKSFVLTFKFDKAKKFILFVDFDHHDNIYKK